MQRGSSKPRIVLVTPPYERIAPGYEFVKHVTNRSPSLGLLHLAAEVREHGYQPSIIECDVADLTADEVAARIISERPPYVGITLFTVGVWNSAWIAKRIKTALPDTVVIVGGPHISSMAEETMRRFGEFDVAVVGEGEEPLLMLLNTLEAGGDLADVPSLVYRDEEELRHTPRHRINRNLDHLPIPAWDLAPGFPRAYTPAIYDFPRHPVATIAASRGCPFHCNFCDTSTFGASVRAYSPERMIEIVQHLQATYGVRHVAFVDDLFLASRRRTIQLCESILENGIEITWSCAARTDTVKPDLLALMKKAGCWEISFGLESGSNEQLHRMDKLADIEKSERAVHWTAEAGIRAKGLFMLGYPGENEATIQATKDFIRRIPMTSMNLTKFTPYPGSPIYREIYGTNIREDHWRKMNGMNFLWSPPGITVAELDRDYQEVLIGFYRRPRMIWYYLKFTVRYPAHFARLSRFLFRLMLAKTRGFLSGRAGLLIQQDQVELDPTD